MMPNVPSSSTWRLYVIIDGAACAGRDPARVAEQAIRGGADVLQLRHKAAPTAELLRQARRLLALTRPAGIPLIVNDRVDVALACGADGVHLGQDDLPIAAARELLGPARLIGKSTHSLEQALAADQEPLDYLALGPIYATPTKPDYGCVGPALIPRVASGVRHPLVATDAVDVVVSNCVLNLVEPRAKRQLFGEIFRVLRKGGRAVISDIVADEEVPEHLQHNPELWSGCLSGALTEEGFLKAFADAGFYGIQLLKRDDAPWRTVEGIEFRSVTVQAFKGKQGPCFDRQQAVIYLGPFREVLDDDGHRMERGRRYAVCDKTYQLYRKEPYRPHFAFVEPLREVPLSEAKPFDCTGPRLRHPRETKGQHYDATTAASQCCDGGNGACG